MNTFRTATGLVFTLTLLLACLPSPTNGQVGMLPDDECKCVDPDGNEIENCRCFRTFDSGQFVWSFEESEPGRLAWRFGDSEPGQFAWSFASPRPRLGITLSVSESENDQRGATIQDVMDAGPGDRAGLQEGDVVTRIDGRSLFDPLQDGEAESELEMDESLPAQRLLHLVGELEPGDEVTIEYLRDGEQQTTSLQAEDLGNWGGNVLHFGADPEGRWDAEAFVDQWKMEEFQDQWAEMAKPEIFFKQFKEGEPRVLSFGPEEGQFEVARGRWFGDGDHFSTCPGSEGDRAFVVLSSECIGGLRMEQMNPKLGEYFGVEVGVLVADVHEGSKLGLEAGDVILRVGDREVTDPGKLRLILRSYEADEEVTLHIVRQKRELTVTGSLAR